MTGILLLTPGVPEVLAYALNADVFINFPVLKHHVATKITMGLKNMMGLVWERGVFHSTDLLQTIAELAATRGITENGPTTPPAQPEI